MNIIELLPLIAGIGLFLFGMNYLGNALDKLTDGKLEALLTTMAKTPLKGMAIGTGLSAVLQSSSAATIMLLGALDAGLLSLMNTIPVIMGANIGTTLTAQLLRLGDLSPDSSIAAWFRPDCLGPILIGLGAVYLVIIRNMRRKELGSFFLGLGLIFFGMATMETTLEPFKTTAEFANMIHLLNNPLLGILIGAAITAILQSSATSIGFVQALSSTGMLHFSNIVPIVLGMNVGRCINVIFVGKQQKKNGKRAVFIDILINFIGMLLFLILIYGYQAAVGFGFWDSVMDRGNIADLHLLFNLITCLILLPFIKLLVTIADKVIKDDDFSKEQKFLSALNDQLLTSPNLALEQCHKATLAMADLAMKNMDAAFLMLTNYDADLLEEINKREDVIDKYESNISNYLARISRLDLTDHDSNRVNNMIQDLVDLERIGDHAVNIAEIAGYDKKNHVKFSDLACQELNLLSEALFDIMQTTIKALHFGDVELAHQVEPLEEVIDNLQEELKNKHIERLMQNKCSVPNGISFVEIIGNIERVSDHCSNIALHLIQSIDDEEMTLDMHAYQNDMHTHRTEAYQKAFQIYSQRYNLDDLDEHKE